MSNIEVNTGPDLSETYMVDLFIIWKTAKFKSYLCRMIHGPVISRATQSGLEY